MELVCIAELFPYTIREPINMSISSRKRRLSSHIDDVTGSETFRTLGFLDDFAATSAALYRFYDGYRSGRSSSQLDVHGETADKEYGILSGRAT